MELTRETRRYFEFSCDVEINHMGIVSRDGIVKFPKNKIDNSDKICFKAPEECIKWIDENMDKIKAIPKVLHIAQQKAVSITDADWDAMRSVMVNPEKFKQEEFVTYESWLAHNVVDLDDDRFSVNALMSFNNNIVGKSVLFGHQWGAPGEGRWFKSRLERVSVDEAIKLLAGSTPVKKLRELLDHVVEKDGSIIWLVPTMYMLGDDVATVRKIDAGIVKDMSIGFKPGKKTPVNDDKGHFWYNEYDDTDSMYSMAFEGSFVFLGAQPGARVRKEFIDEILKEMKIRTEPQDALTGEDKDLPPMAMDQTNKETKTMKMKIEATEFNIEKQEDADVIQAKVVEIVHEYEEKVKVAMEEVTAKDAEITELKSVLDGKTLEDVRNAFTVSKAFRDFQISEVMKWGKMAKVVDETNETAKQVFFEKCDVETLKMLAADYRKIHDERNPHYGQMNENTDDKTSPQKSVKLTVPDNAVEMN